MDYFSGLTAHRGAYYQETTPDADSSVSSSPDNINDPYRYGSLNAGVFPPDQTWNPVDMTSVHTMTDDIDSASSIHESGMLPPATTDSEQGASVAPSKMRRRAQNRASQRAFRERKERHVKGLEHQLELLNEKHQDLLCTYNKQSEGVAKLNRRIAQLTADLKALKASSTPSPLEVPRSNMAVPTVQTTTSSSSNSRVNQLPHHRHQHPRHFHAAQQPMVPDKFDAFSFTSYPRGAVLYDGYELDLDGSIVNTADGSHPGAGGGGGGSSTGRNRLLPEFEDLLNMS